MKCPKCGSGQGDVFQVINKGREGEVVKLTDTIKLYLLSIAVFFMLGFAFGLGIARWLWGG